MACSSSAPRLNLQPSMWGPYAWMFLYTAAMGYPNTPSQQDKDAVKNLFASLTHLLPCELCRHNLTEKLNGPFGGTRLEDAVACSETLTRFVYDLEAAVAAKNGKPIASYDDVKRGVMTNTYKQRAARANTLASPASLDTNDTKSMTALWVLLPIAVAISILVTWGVTRRLVRAKSL